MALPRFLYSDSDSVHQKFIPESGCDEPLLVSPKTNRDFTGALSKSKKEIANNPALRPSFIGNLQVSSESEGGAEDTSKEDASAQEFQGNRREWEFGAAAVAMELSEPGAGAGGEGSDSASDESGVLEYMGEERRSSERKKKKKEGNGVVVRAGGRAINDGGGNSESFRGASRSTMKRLSTVLSDPGDYVFYKDDETRTKWEEAAIYVREGEDNAKFFHHPKGRWSKLAFFILHHPAYYITHLLLTTLLMLLALLETPPSNEIDASVRQAILSVHGVIEILVLTLLGVDIVFRYMWFRPRQFFTHTRTIMITVVLAVMYVEVITVLIRQQNHFRITRALRPMFFIDNYLMNGVRRVLRQIFQSIKPILDVLLLLLILLSISSLLGYYIFARVDPDYFLSFKRSFVSLFITMTTANHPDVMMEAYLKQAASPIFFIIFVILTVYSINNVLLAVVYSSFSNANKVKFRKLFLHKRKALQLAYNVLAANSKGIQFHDFLIFMQNYRPKIPEWQVMCIFKALHKDPKEQHKELSLEEFYSFYEVRDLKWKQATTEGVTVPWFDRVPRRIRAIVKVCYKVVKSKPFNIIINLIVLSNLLFLVIYTLAVDGYKIPDIHIIGETEKESLSRFIKLHKVLPVSFIFVIIYILEIVLRIIGVGFYDYFRKIWNTLDFVVIFGSFICLLLEINYFVLALVRPIKLFRLLRLKRRHRDIMDTLVVLVPRLVSVGVLLVVVYYFFAIIGIETLHDRVMAGCCNKSWYDVELYYRGMYEKNTSLADIPATPDVFYILNFDNILRSYVTLFSLMVVNNWYVIMEGFASQVEADWLVRIYFMCFIIITLVVLQVVISFIVEAFVFKIQAKEKGRECHKHHKPLYLCGCKEEPHHKKTVIITLVPEDIAKLRYEVTYSNERHSEFSLSGSIMKLRRINLPESGRVAYLGRRRRTKDDIQLQMYRTLLQDWIKDEEELKAQLEDSQKKKERLLPKLWKFSKNFVEYVIE